MKKTPKKILQNARSLFNTEGVSNVRLQDIAKRTGISPGNLSYHYPTKKELMQAVLALLAETSSEMRGLNMTCLEQEEYLSVIKNYLRFQIDHRFFYRDILDIINLVTEAKEQYELGMNQVITFTKNGMNLAVGKGLIKPESHDGSFHFFAKNIWAILNSWLVEREVRGEEKVGLDQVMLAIWEFHYPYFTKKGLDTYHEIRDNLSVLIEVEPETA